MTRTNLTEHLSWLLSSCSLIPPQSPNCHVNERDDASQLTNTLIHHIIEVDTDVELEPTTTGRRQGSSDVDIAPPQTSPRGLKVSTQDEMARLQTVTFSARKPHLVSESTPITPQASLPRDGRPSGTTLTERYTNLVSNKNGEDFDSVTVRFE